MGRLARHSSLVSQCDTGELLIARGGTLTYMSIEEWINRLVEDGRLFPLKPVFKGDSIRRPMFMSEEVRDLIEGPWTSTAAATRCGKLRADLEAFVVGAELSICLLPYNAKDAQMGLLSPAKDGVWDVRSQGPSPGIRVLGRFARQDWFLALIPASRSRKVDYIARGPLDDRDSQAWDDVISDTRRLWQSLCPAYSGIGGDDAREYFSDRYNPI